MRLILLLLTMAAVVGCDTQKAETQQGAGAAAQAEGGNASAGGEVDRSQKGKPLPESELFDADNDPSALTQLKGQPVLVNLWAIWCAPCVKELPTLQALSKRKNVDVIAVSQDMAPRSSVDAFLAKNALGDLEVWHDPKMALSGALGVQILPTTILYGADGKEIWRYTGDLDWSGEEAAKLLADADARS